MPRLRRVDDGPPFWASFLLLAPVGAFVLNPRLRAVAQLAPTTADGPLSDALVAGSRDPVLGAGLRTFVAVLAGIVFLMTTKPPLVSAFLAMGAAFVLGLVYGVPEWWRARTRTARTISASK